jgi:hypothetical protein
MYARFEVIIALKIPVIVFLVVTLCSVIGGCCGCVCWFFVNSFIHSIIHSFLSSKHFRFIIFKYPCPYWSSGQSYWLQIQRSGFDSWPCQTFWEAVGLECGPLGLVSKTEELLWRNYSGSGLETWEYCCGDPLCCPCVTLYLQMLALTSPTSSGRSVGIVRSQTEATEVFSSCP